MKENRMCAKCGVRVAENSNLRFHRFPAPGKNYLKVHVWAKFCFPNEDWSSCESLDKLSKSHKLLCSMHFNEPAYTCCAKLRLNKFAIPFEAEHILAMLRAEASPSTSVTTNVSENLLEPTVMLAHQNQLNMDLDLERSGEILNPRQFDNDDLNSGINMAKRPPSLPDNRSMFKRMKKLEQKLGLDSNDSDEWPVERLEGDDKEDSESSMVLLEDEEEDDSDIDTKQEIENFMKKEEEGPFEVSEEVLKLLGNLPEECTLGKKIVPELAGRVEIILKSGLKKEERDAIAKKHRPPENCKFVGGPKLNPEIAATLSLRQVAVDKKNTAKQQKLGTALSAIMSTADNLIRQGDKENVESLLDALYTLADVQHLDTKMRKNTIVPILDKKLQNFIEDSSSEALDEYLFGKGLTKKK